MRGSQTAQESKLRLIFNGAAPWASAVVLGDTTILGGAALQDGSATLRAAAILGGAALQRCDNCMVLTAALAAEVKAQR
jgi:hypothetical protein